MEPAERLKILREGMDHQFDTDENAGLALETDDLVLLCAQDMVNRFGGWHELTVADDPDLFEAIELVVLREYVTNHIDSDGVEEIAHRRVVCSKLLRIKNGDERNRDIPGEIEWWEHLEVWSGYAKSYGTQQSPRRIEERGGFSFGECKTFLGHDPITWKPY